MLSRLAQRIRSFLALPFRPHFEYLEARIENIEFALHRDFDELRRLIDERSFAMAKLVEAGVEQRLAARLDTEVVASQERARSFQAQAREHAEAASAASAVAAVTAAREHVEAAVAAASLHTAQQLAGIRTEIDRLSRSRTRVATVSGSVERPPVAAQGEWSTAAQGSPIDDLLYLAIEDQFRGSASVVLERQERYLSLVADQVDAEHPLLDLGCGRGEWLQLLSENGVPARGIDSNESSVAECVARGLDASLGDLVETLAASADDSFGAITLFHVVEHLPFAVLAEVFSECVRVLVPEGVLIAETPNALNLRVAATNFWLDPTHVRPLHPQLLRLLGERAGFARMEDLFLHDLGEPIDVSLGDPQVDNWLTELSRSLDGPGDYSLLAWTSSAPSG